MKTDYQGALQQIKQQIRKPHPVWLLHGDEPLLSQQILTELRKHWQQHGVERQRIDLGSTADWRDAFNELDSLSLFASQTAVEVHGNHKPDAATLLLLERFIQQSNDNQLVIVMPKQDAAAQKTKFYKLLEAQALVVALSIRDEAQRRQLLQQLAKQQQLQLTDAAWSLLLEHTQNNLLAAHQALLRLSALHDGNTAADVADLQPALVEQSRFSTFDLGDAALSGQAEKAVQILQFLKESGEPTSLVLWTLSKEMRLVMQLLAQPNTEQQLGIWQNRVGLYRQACRRLSRADTADWSELLRQADESIKGIRDEPTWDLLLRCTLGLAGIRLFG